MKPDNISELKNRKWFIYDDKAQQELSNYNKMLVEMAFAQPLDWDYEPEAYCIISTGPTMCRNPEAIWDVDTCDYDALVSLVGHLESIKSKAVNRINELDGPEDEGDEQ